MEPNRHYEYQAHHHQSPHSLQQLQHQHINTHPQHAVQSHIHHQQQQTSAAAPQQRFQQSGSTSDFPNSISYNNIHSVDTERSRGSIYVMSGRNADGGSNTSGGGAAASAMPSTGAASSSGGDPHLQYYTSNRELIAGKRTMETSPHSCWQYKTTHATTPTGAAPRHQSSAMYTAPYWPPQDEQSQQPTHVVHQQQPPCFGYSKSQILSRPSTINSSITNSGSAVGSSGSGCSSSLISQRYYEDNVKYSAAVPGAKAVSYTPTTGAATTQQLTAPAARYELIDQVVNPSNALLGSSDQQPSPNYARKCPQHYDLPTEQRTATTPLSINHHVTPSQHQQQHQSLYMPPNFQNTVHNAIEKYVRETTPAPSLDYRRSGINYSHPIVSYYEKVVGSGSTSSSAACGKLKADPPALARASLYHNPYHPPTDPASALLSKEQPPPVSATGSSRDPSPVTAHVYPTKYGKLLPQHGTLTPSTPALPPSVADMQHRSSYGSTTSYASYYFHGTPSPATAQVASPTPAQQLYNHTPPPASGTPSASNYSTLQVYPHGPDICYQQPVTSKATLPAIPKKITASKPNYRELINDMLMRNTTSEKERNMQIIKKTLNIEAPCNRLAAIPARQSPVTIKVPPMLAPVIQQVPLPQPLPNPPAAQSPLDLSMRTIKQTADSTDYKYQRTQTDFKPASLPGTSTAAGTGLGLPRFDITASFARSSNRTASSPAAATAVIRQAPASTSAATTSVAALNATPMVIKAAQQLRPSVLETNPFAKRLQLSPETNIRALPKTSPGSGTSCASTSAINSGSSTSNIGFRSTGSVHNSSNPNYLGRKRHLQEYNQAAAAEAAAVAAAKQLRLDTPQAIGIAASVPVIAVNEQALVAKQLEQPSPPICSRVIICPNPKQETGMVGFSKTEPRIRTKAELKGFTFTPPIMAPTSLTTTTTTSVVSALTAAESTADTPAAAGPSPTLHPRQLSNHIQIKLESAPSPELELDNVNMTSFNSTSLLDWGSTCNNLVEQLLTKVMPVKTLPIHTAVSPNESNSQMLPTRSIKVELSEDDLPVARILKQQPPPGDAESAATTTTQLTNTTTTNGLGLSGGQKKLSKTDREKKRLVQEQRIAARLAPTAGQSSSSESDTTELHKRKTARQKKPLMRKGKARRSDEKGKQIEEHEHQSSDEKQQQPSHSSNEAVSSSNAKKTRISITKQIKLQYTNEMCKIKGGGKQCDQKEESENDQAYDKISSSSKTNSDDDQQEENEEDDDDEHEADVEGRNGDESKRKPKTSLKNRVSLNTMTRSKRKKELELQLANSKVLRNDKVIRNSTTKIKRKYVRKLVPDCKKEMMITRLRNKRDSVVDLVQLNGRQLKGKSKSGSANNTNSNSKSSTSPQQQLFLEEYRYKLALKIPKRLISINKLNKLPPVAASLPDLERDRDISQELVCFKHARGRKPRAKLHLQQQQQKEFQQQMSTPKSIIDVLHLRVTSNGSQQNSKNNALHPSNCATSLHNYSETSQTSASNSLYGLLQETENSLEDTSCKRHFSIFDTKVLQSKTRTESKLQQRREIIREIFEGTERPASAPPECAQEEAGEEISALSYQQYEDYLDQMNRMVSANNNKLTRHCFNDESKEVIATPRIITTVPHYPHKRKYLRRKGSSGFDYIRKKKRPTHHHNTTNNSTAISTTNASAGEHAIPTTATSLVAIEAAAVAAAAAAAAADERMDDTDSTLAGSTFHLPMKLKTEMDVCREIQKWVLNKSVGQSTMHKAARQGLIDVVVYCLDRMGMNPDQKDNAGYTPLHEACTQGWLEIARILLQFGANHSVAAQSGIRPLHGAIENDHEEVVRLLLSYGADPLLATYSGQTPLMLASSKLMGGILSSHLSDAQSAAADIKPIRFKGPWEILDEKKNGFDIFDNLPQTACDMSRAQPKENRRQGSSHGDNENPGQPKTNNYNNNINHNRNGLLQANDIKDTIKQNGEISAKTASTIIITTTKTRATTKVKIESGPQEKPVELGDTNNNKNHDISVEENVTSVVNGKNDVKQEPHDDVENVNINVIVKDSELNEHNNRIDNDDHNDTNKDKEALADELNGDIFKFEEADVPLPPLYLLKDEGSDKWVLLNDLCNLLKVKSKDTLLNKICPNGNTLASTQKQLLREFKIDDFLKQATCLQLLCAGEKLNMFSSAKVVLIRYNESVKNLLGVKTILMKF